MSCLASPAIVGNLHEISNIISKYLSDYVHFLNKFIGHLRRVSSLRFERTTLIKYVKKLRFLNDVLNSYDILQDLEVNEKTDLTDVIKPLASFYLKCMELLDILNFYLTQPLQKEILSKTLNSDLNLPDECIFAIEDTYNHFVKFTQWMVESLNIDNPLLQIEVVQFTRKCAIEDNIDMDDTNDIFLQEVVPVTDAEEYDHLSKEWASVLHSKMATLENDFNDVLAEWQNKFEKKKDSKRPTTVNA